MLNFIEFIRKYYFILLFILLEFIVLVLTGTRQARPKAFFINSSNSFESNVFNNYFKISEYFSLKNENNKLLKENRLLNNFKRNIDTSITNYKTDTSNQYIFYSAKIVKNSILNENNFITLNKGSTDGIKPDMGVISPNGAVGVVTNVSKHFCLVLSLLNKLNSIGCKLKNSNYFGSASWDGKSYKQVLLSGIPNHVDISKGDTIVTSGYGAIFPGNIDVGTIDTFWKNNDNNFFTVRVNLSTNFKNTTNVYIVKNNYINEQKELEKQIEDYN